METVLKFERVILTKELNDKVKKVGDVFEIANVLDGSFLLREAKSKTAVGVVSFEDFDKHFVKEGEFKGWTQWTPLVGFDGQNDVFYRTNMRKTQVKFVKDKVRAESCRNKNDDYNLYLGVQIAYLRCCNKLLNRQHQECYDKKLELEDKMYDIKGEIIENEQILKKMINSIPI